MSKLFVFAAALLISSSAFAQEISSKLILQKGDIIKVNNEMSSSNTASMGGGEPMESKTTSNSYTELEVKEVTDKQYILTQTLKTMKLDFDGFGQKMSYNSENKEKQDNPFIKQLAEKVGVPEEFKVGFDGKVIEDAKEEEGKKGGGKGMMKMMGMTNSSAVQSAFLVIPADAVSKGGWEETTEKDGLKTRKKYTLGAMMGSMATVTVQSQTKGDVEMNRGGMAMTSKINTTAEEMIMVNISTGRVQMHTVNMNNNSKTIMNDTENPSTGKTTMTTTFE